MPQVEIVDPGAFLCVDFGGCPENHAGGPIAPCARRLIDPHGLWPRRRGRRVAQKTLGVRRIGLREHAGPLRDLRLGESIVHVVRGEQPESHVVMFMVVPLQERPLRVRACTREPKQAGNAGRYFRVLN